MIVRLDDKAIDKQFDKLKVDAELKLSISGPLDEVTGTLRGVADVLAGKQTPPDVTHSTEAHNACGMESCDVSAVLGKVVTQADEIRRLNASALLDKDEIRHLREQETANRDEIASLLAQHEEDAKLVEYLAEKLSKFPNGSDSSALTGLPPGRQGEAVRSVGDVLSEERLSDRKSAPRSEISLNDRVWAKVTVFGASFYTNHWRKMGVDHRIEAGWHRFHLWEIASVFGETLHNGGTLPFETTALRLTPPDSETSAAVAQSEEHPPRNREVAGSTPVSGSNPLPDELTEAWEATRDLRGHPLAVGTSLQCAGSPGEEIDAVCRVRPVELVNGLALCRGCASIDFAISAEEDGIEAARSAAVNGSPPASATASVSDPPSVDRAESVPGLSADAHRDGYEFEALFKAIEPELGDEEDAATIARRARERRDEWEAARPEEQPMRRVFVARGGPIDGAEMVFDGTLAEATQQAASWLAIERRSAARRNLAAEWEGVTIEPIPDQGIPPAEIARHEGDGSDPAPVRRSEMEPNPTPDSTLPEQSARQEERKENARANTTTAAPTTPPASTIAARDAEHTAVDTGASAGMIDVRRPQTKEGEIISQAAPSEPQQVEGAGNPTDTPRAVAGSAANESKEVAPSAGLAPRIETANGEAKTGSTEAPAADGKPAPLPHGPCAICTKPTKRRIPAGEPSLREAFLPYVGKPLCVDCQDELTKKKCAGLKKDGTPCTFPPKGKTGFCGFHQDQAPAEVSNG